MGLQIFKKLYRTLNEDDIFRVSVAEQKAFLEKQPEPKDDFERSYLQYRAQMFLLRKGMPLLLNLAALPLLALYALRPPKGGMQPLTAQTDAVLLFADSDSIVPASLRREFTISQCKDFQAHLLLTGDDFRFLRQLRRRYPFAFYFRLKCMLKVSMFRSVIDACQPKALICSEEYSFTSSVLTAYCQQMGVEHINIMHGEKLFYIRDSFFHFDRCYIWDEGYRKLFTALRADPTQFCVALPPDLQPWDATGIEKTVDYTYYLQAEDGETLKKIASALRTLREQGNVVAVRPHPLYSDLAQVRELFHGCLIEDKANTDIRTSILRTRHVISAYSTVLLQAYTNGVPIVIDDISNSGHFQHLRELQYQMLSVEHTLLSECTAE